MTEREICLDCNSDLILYTNGDKRGMCRNCGCMWDWVATKKAIDNYKECPECDSTQIRVLRDGKCTRMCTNCNRRWFPLWECAQTRQRVVIK